MTRRRSGPDGAPPPGPDRPLSGDLLLAVAFVAASLFVLMVGNPDAGAREADASLWRTVLTVVLTALPLAWRRVHPLAVLAWSAVASAAHAISSVEPLPTDYVLPVALYSYVAFGRGSATRRWLLAGVAVLPVLVIAFATVDLRSWRLQAEDAVVLLFLLVMLWLVPAGVAEVMRRLRRTAADQLASRATERRREAAARRRLAADLHDSVGHFLTVTILEADRLAERGDSAAAVPAQAGRRAMAELQALVGLLRAAAEDAATEPGPDLLPTVAHVDDVVEPLRRHGTRVTVNVDVRGPLPLDVDITAYRIIQEALTNVVRHSGARTVTITVSEAEDHLVVAVDDDGRGADGPGAPRPGRGLPGLQDRARLVGGQVTAGPRPEGGFAVRALLPLSTPSRSQ